ncbi:MAG: hypothetical protein SWO11_16950 [Thermodesulfobacteriota bacterium]|nr:hypothetical protein [Thermodesulfobacteriota bacterium]
MADFPVAVGLTSMSGTYIPEIWAGQTNIKFYDVTVFGEITNTDYQGEITKYGDKVHIRVVPDITISRYRIGQDLDYDRPATTDVELNIDYGYSYSFEINTVELKQSDLDYVEKWTDDASENLAIEVDTVILAGIYGSAGANNAGATAGRISSGFNLGTAAAPLSVDKTNLLDLTIDAGSVLTESRAPLTNRWIVYPEIFCGMIQKGDLKDASLAGDATSIARNGRLGVINRLHVYSSNNVHVSSSVFDVVFGHPSCVCFASQLVENEIVPNPKDFGKLQRGLHVFGYLVNNGDGVGHIVAQKA